MDFEHDIIKKDKKKKTKIITETSFGFDGDKIKSAIKNHSLVETNLSLLSLALRAGFYWPSYSGCPTEFTNRWPPDHLEG